MAVDGKYDVEINGQGFPLYKGQYSKDAEDIYAQPQELSTTPGERPLSSFWSQKRYSDFSGGYNQRYAEAENSQANRFLDSSGIDVSTPGEAKLMRAMAASLAKTGTNGYLIPCYGLLWLVDGTNIYGYNGSAWTAAKASGVTGNISCFAADPSNVLVYGTSGAIRRYFVGGDSWSDFNTAATGLNAILYSLLNGSVLWGVKARYFQKIESGTTITDIYDAGTATFILNCLCEHNRKIAFGGYMGQGGDEKSYVWESDGTTAGTSVLVDDLPIGFKITGLLSYSDILFIYGGWYTSSTLAVGGVYGYTNGALTFLGRLNETAHVGDPNPTVAPTIDMVPYCAFPYGQFVYFGMNEGTGLWRYDLKQGGLSRSWSAAATTNKVTGTAWFKGKTFVAYSGAGAFVEQTTYVSSGWIKPSATTMGNSNKKLGRRFILAAAASAPNVSYIADALPANASPAWTKDAVGSPTESVSAGILTTTGGTTTTQYYYIADANLSNATGTTLEARLKIGSNPDTDSTRAALRIYDGSWGTTLAILADHIQVYSLVGGGDTATYYMTTTDDYHTYRLTVKGTSAKVYVDGTLRMTTTLFAQGAGGKQIWFGDIDGGTGNHTEYWDYVRYQSWATNPFVVDVSSDLGATLSSLVADDTYKEYALASIGLWDNLMPKITISDSTAIIQDITIEAVPTLSDLHTWEMVLDLSNPLQTIEGDDENINSQTVYEALEAARANKIAVTFRDIDHDISSTKPTYNVLIEKLSRGGVEVDSGDNEVRNIIKIKLREF